ncbi:hypothetical protein C1645_819553 [Glomus cerebriforme]|uniref:Antitoxin SocA-like Panacea domain-containing protein n=1 Tax=Glomus cerebriforme TaxID=658196 RepID=A0A397TAS6_9GLOM|nr:hypothetical protein C1645_819553 [Glomus cerebriforme]
MVGNNLNLKPAKYDASSIAKYLLSLDPNREYFENKRAKNEITSATITTGNFRLNQMLYLIQILYYLKYERLLFNDKFYAWENGMVIYSVYTHFSSLYYNVNGKNIKNIEDGRIKTFISKCFNYLKTNSDRVLQEFAFTDPVWTSTWGRSSQPEVNFTDKENIGIYRQCCSR